MFIDEGGSEYRPCGDNCGWKYNADTGLYDFVHGCAVAGAVCSSPDDRKTRFGEYRCTLCSSTAAVARLALDEFQEGGRTRRYVVMLPRIENPAEIARVTDVVSYGGTGRFFSSRFGWLLSLRHRAADAGPVVPPAAPPLSDPLGDDRTLKLAVLLQNHEGRLDEHSFPVAASRPWSVLTTSEWELVAVALRPFPA